MKNILGAALLATLSPAFLSAESYATVIKIKPNYQTKTKIGRASGRERVFLRV